VLKGISSMATRGVLADLGGAYQRRGLPVSIESVGGVDAARRVESGEEFDFAVLAPPAIDRLAAVGRIDARTRTGIARSRIAIAVRDGAPSPGFATEGAVREALQAARAIGYSTGPSGAHLARLLERWGIAQAMAPRLVLAPPGVAVATLVARGEAEIGFQQLSELNDVPGVAVAGLLPDAIQEITVFTGAVCAASRHAPEARAWLAFCAAPEAAEVKRRRGMEP
jgi:molybdate transport system substrate-binding protein